MSGWCRVLADNIYDENVQSPHKPSTVWTCGHQLECGLPDKEHHLYVGLQKVQGPIYWREPQIIARQVLRTSWLREEQPHQEGDWGTLHHQGPQAK